MDLSIIIVNWNTRAMLRDCLHSVFDGSPKGSFEVLVVDNASNDGSAAMVSREFPATRLYCNSENVGFAAANNQVIQRARGRYILLLNSDTLVHGDVLQQSIEFMDSDSNAGAMGCRVLNRDGTLQHSTSQFPSFLNLTMQTLGLDRINGVPFFKRYRMLDWDRTTTRNVDTVSGCYMMVRRECVNEVGLLDERFFFFGEETDWCRRMRAADWDVVFAPVGEITHFGGGSSGGLNHKRDVMLSEATVKLHRKYNGPVVSLAVFLLLFVFNSSRFVFWWFQSRRANGRNHLVRMKHFFNVTVSFAAAWPTGKGTMS
ncbi:glycosyltransferase family 2 protein [Kordiimonas aquimaris]|uniref:glycosyltransferase family 2 protein n=1 Tax=Kordiimonas aquimaris TaxID=707591 RepID=UPI0021CF7A15|nr:glycosyltransferase family 2 protein [Kordiimonas aquimaris]